jgi:5'-3' exoribonuclease 2
MAKMEQQRLRRFKGLILGSGEKPAFNTVQITPGTPFMALLSEKIEAAFAGDASVIVATSTGPGEGEQKLFAHLRANPQTGANVAVYGLDADLIMLSLFHLDYARNIFVCREEPHSDKKNKGRDNHGVLGVVGGVGADLVFLDAAALSRTLCAEMAAPCRHHHITENPGIEEYAFLCFFLGNDFMPHFPALKDETRRRAAAAASTARAAAASAATLAAAADAALAEVHIESDGRGSAAYKQHLLRVHLARAVRHIMQGSAGA